MFGRTPVSVDACATGSSFFDRRADESGWVEHTHFSPMCLRPCPRLVYDTASEACPQDRAFWRSSSGDQPEVVEEPDRQGDSQNNQHHPAWLFPARLITFLVAPFPGCLVDAMSVDASDKAGRPAPDYCGSGPHKAGRDSGRPLRVSLPESPGSSVASIRDDCRAAQCGLAAIHQHPKMNPPAHKWRSPLRVVGRQWGLPTGLPLSGQNVTSSSTTKVVVRSSFNSSINCRS